MGNISEAPFLYSAINAGQVRAQSFSAPPGSAYAVTNVTLMLVDPFGGGSQVSVALHADSAGFPGALIQTLTNAMSVSGSSEAAYVIPVGGAITLQPSTKYWILAAYVGGSPGWGNRTSQGSGLGSMGTDHAYSNDGGFSWIYDTFGQYYAMAVQGTLLDYGDAPFPYPVTRSDDGARHVPRGPVLGALVDGEADGIASALATGDDADASDDEDGVAFGRLVAGSSAVMTVTVSVASGRIDAWLDWNRDASWAAGEQFVTNRAVNAGVTNLLFNVPANALAGTNFARVRISSAGGLAATGIAEDGEVEDHAVVIIVNVTRYVSLSGSHLAPFTSWATAATTIQAAVDAAIPGDTILVTNGMYQSGGRPIAGAALTNRVFVDKPVVIRSVNGPAVTFIRGAWTPFIGGGYGDASARCVYLTNDASLSGFTLTNGATRFDVPDPRDVHGGAAYLEPAGVLSNCWLIGCNAISNGGGAFQGRLVNCLLTRNGATIGGGTFNSGASNCVFLANGASQGGGAYTGTLDNCTVVSNIANYGGGTQASLVRNSALIRNTAFVSGGGAFNGLFQNCTIAFNAAQFGGGLYGNVAPACYNSIVWGNSAPNYTNYESGSFFYSCSDPLPSGLSNISADPRFENPPGNSFRLQASSPCRNTGFNTYASGGFDLDGLPRITGGAVDMGAYEFADSDGDGLPDWWESQYGLNPAVSNNVVANADLDLLNDLEEYVAGTNPTNPASQFTRISLGAPASPDTVGLLVSNSSGGRLYSVYAVTNLLGPQTWTLIPPETSGNGSNLVISVPATNPPFRAIRAAVRLP